ncbi:unnamed protein product [Adineta steineri]|uniref:Sphingomyelin phosphodiesterase n=1 Tax=Adineta steineri TaxID=433720 RepID=A0A815R6L7_9BILA|nr:unnamed protein product [Adineta steineri]CAF1636365.1 unnamed protein product [Adineta steineri]
MVCFTHIVLFFFFAALSTVDTRSIQNNSDVELLIQNRIVEKKQLSATIASYRHRFEHSPNFKKLRWALSEKLTPPYCEFCHLFVPAIRFLIEINETIHVENVTIALCKDIQLFLNIEVCVGAVLEYKDAAIEIFSMSPLTNKELCALAFDCEDQKDFPILRWNVTIPGSKPSPRPPQPPASGSPKLKVLHLSDIHVDFAYKPGTQADCHKPLCCRDGPTIPGPNGAGFWGDYRNCDLPYWTAQSILRYASELEEDIDFIYYTGDLPPHNVWNQSRADQLYSLTTINQLLAATFSNKTFYPAVGNHEAAPCNMYPTPSIRTDNITWLYEALADSWATLGLPADTRESIVRGAFYTTMVRPGLRLISLNMNYCAPENYWLFVNATDPLGQLQWMIQWLQYAEDHGEKVHIIAHHPPRSCLAAFSWNFHQIINRYENTIAGQFYGHTHNDEFIVFYDEVDKKRAVSMAYVTPSLTPQSFLNPGYRIYTMDGAYENSSYWVLDHRTVIMNLTATNMYNRTILLNEYEARDAYKMENLFPADWDNLIQRMQNDIDGSLMSSAYQYYTKSYTNGTSCNRSCRRGLLCNFKTARSDDPHACDSIPSYY